MPGEIAFPSLLIGPRVNPSHSHAPYSAEVHSLPPDLWAWLMGAQSPARIALKNDPAAHERLWRDPWMRRKSIARSRLRLPTMQPGKRGSSCRAGCGRSPLKLKAADGSGGRATRGRSRGGCLDTQKKKSLIKCKRSRRRSTARRFPPGPVKAGGKQHGSLRVSERGETCIRALARIPQDNEGQPTAMPVNLLLHSVTCRFRDICNRLSSTSISRGRS